jgi:DNA repair photolyase
MSKQMSLIGGPAKPVDKPATGVAEWASSSENVSTGCPHGCLYCYAHEMAERFKRVPPDGWTAMIGRPSARGKMYGKRQGRIMFPTTHDIIPGPGGNLGLCASALERMLGAGNEVLIVSKPHPEAIELLCTRLRRWRSQVMFRFTIGSRSRAVLAFWEPGAPEPYARLRALEHAHSAGYATSVSMEPMLDTEEDAIVELVEELAPLCTDSIWLGKANRLVERLTRNGHWGDVNVRDAAREIIASQSDTRIRALYQRLKNHPVVRWKDSVKEVVGIARATEAGLDR